MLALLLLASAVFLSLRSFQYSSGHPFPTFDEVEYLDQSRAVASDGMVSTVGSFLDGRNTYAERNPFTMMLLSFLMDGSPRDFTRAKLFSLTQMLFLLLAVFTLGKRIWGRFAATGAACLLALSPFSAQLSQQVLADILFVVFFFSSIALFLLSDRKKVVSLAGILAGLAYLTKENGYLLLLVPLVLDVHERRWRSWKKARFPVAALFFLATASFLVIRNFRLAGTPFYNSINHVLWLDDWRYFWILKSSPVWSTIGPAWYFSHHSFGDIIVRLWNGLIGATINLFMCIGVGFRNQTWQFATGLLLTVAGGAGMFGRWRSGGKKDVLAVGAIVGIVMVGLIWITPATGLNFRYAFPIGVLLLPYVFAGLEKYKSPILWVLLATLTAGIGGLAWKSPAYLRNPLSYWNVPPFWQEASAWISNHSPDDPFLISHKSPYSLWNIGPDRRSPFPYDVPTELIRDHVERNGIQTAVVDQSVDGRDPFQDKYGPEDAHGPLTFLGWNRCFHDSFAPSVLLIYGRDCGGERAEN